MKKTNFTLIMALSFLLLGASWNGAKAQSASAIGFSANYAPEGISGTPSFETVRYYFNTATQKETVYGTTPSSWTYSSTTGLYFFGATDYSRTTLSNALIGTGTPLLSSIHQIFTVKIPYTDGKEIIPFLDVTLVLGADKDHLTKPFGGIVLPTKRESVPNFTYGSGTATYTYDINLSELYGKYTNLWSISYTLWTGYEWTADHNNPNDEPFGPAAINREYSINAATGITVDKALNGYIAGGTLRLAVKAQPGRNIDVATTLSDKSSVNKVDKGSGNWEVTIKGITKDFDITLGYANTTESGPNGNEALTKDGVWASAGTLYVNTATPGILTVYSITGQLVKSVAVAGNKTISLAKGVYLVKLNGKTVKVLL
jgi:hypothetical protein